MNLTVDDQFTHENDGEVEIFEIVMKVKELEYESEETAAPEDIDQMFVKYEVLDTGTIKRHKLDKFIGEINS